MKATTAPKPPAPYRPVSLKLETEEEMNQMLIILEEIAGDTSLKDSLRGFAKKAEDILQKADQ